MGSKQRSIHLRALLVIDMPCLCMCGPGTSAWLQQLLLSQTSDVPCCTAVLRPRRPARMTQKTRHTLLALTKANKLKAEVDLVVTETRAWTSGTPPKQLHARSAGIPLQLRTEPDPQDTNDPISVDRDPPVSACTFCCVNNLFEADC